MKPSPISTAILVVSLLLAPALFAQAPAPENQSAASPAQRLSAAEVPRLIKFNGTLLDAQERPMAGPVGVTFALYSHQTGGAALWVETQNVKPDANGTYSVLLGANSANGVPAELFVSGEARWLGIQVGQQPERERILLVSVPYALKAGDAETLGGLPASAFVTTGVPGNTANAGGAASASSSSTGLPKSTATTPKKASSTPQPATACTSLTSDGTATANSIGLFTAPCNLQSSVITQSSGNVGFGTTTPAVAVDVVGNNAGLRLSGTGTHQVTVTGASSGRLGEDATGFFFSSDTNGKVIKFLTNNGTLNEWMRITSAGNVGIGTTTPAAKLDINGNQNITGNVSLSGILALPNTTSPAAGVITLGSARFVHNFGNNTFVGANAGNFTMSGSGNVAFGSSALGSNTTGQLNSAFGFNVLTANTTGFQNSAFGYLALALNTTGSSNTASGASALGGNTIGNNNTASGIQALAFNTTGSNNTATGLAALVHNTTGNLNSAFGDSALSNLGAGNSNIAIGSGAGGSLTTGSSNIYIGNTGVASESNTIRIGDPAVHTATFIAGTIMGNLSGSATSFTGNLAGEVTGTQGATVVSNAVTADTANAIVRRDSSGNFSAGTVTLAGNLALPSTTSISVGVVTMGGPRFLHNFGTQNTFLGEAAGNVSLTGDHNTGVGGSALLGNTSGAFNSAFGTQALESNMTGSQNAAFGSAALFANTRGTGNSAFGYGALMGNSIGINNSVFGDQALPINSAGMNNSAFGVTALQGLSSGNSNIAIGAGAGSIVASGSNNIYIGNLGGATTESNTIRIGSGQMATFMAGINGATSASGVAVFINPSGQLGTVMSSRRYKHQIGDMGVESDLLMKLRPVAFYYNPELDETQTRQYGLVAEEVAQVAPQLVVFDKGGAPQTVRYHFVNAMLLNEVQKQRQMIEEHQRVNEKQRQLAEEQQSTIVRQQAEIQGLAARLAKLEALLSLTRPGR